MVKAWCIWCETGASPSNSDYYWIHYRCAMQLMDIHREVNAIKKMLLGIHPRNKKDKDKLNVVCNYIKDIEVFKKRWDNIERLMQRMSPKHEDVI